MTSNTETAGYKVALNPIQWMASDDGLLDPALAPPLGDQLRMIAEAGYAGVHAAVPLGMSVKDYAALLEKNGLAPAPGYYGIAMPEDGARIAEVIERGRVAAAEQAALGLDTMFLACGMSRADPVRLVTPGVGANADQARLEALTGQLASVAEAMKVEGVKAALHPHVGTWVETEEETRHVLDSVPAGVLGFGPDTGHLCWAGADVVGLYREYRDRVKVTHIKDIRLDVRDAGRAAGKSYGETVLDGLWTEPGGGSVDIEGPISALGPDFDGWLVVEVDRPTTDPFESAKISARWTNALRKPVA